MLQRMYQREWLGIRFADVARLSARHVADSAFYENFYAALFARYPEWDALDPQWRALKGRYAELVLSRIPDRARNVLSVGCGLGYMEHLIARRLGAETRLHVQEIAPTGLRWLVKELPAQQIHLGWIPECLRGTPPFDLVYLSGIDYAMRDAEFAALLDALGRHVAPGGEVLVISVSCLPEAGALRSFRIKATDGAKRLLSALHLYDPGQFWGWARERKSYRQLFAKLGWRVGAEGRVDLDGHDYWIAGCPTGGVAGRAGSLR